MSNIEEFQYIAFLYIIFYLVSFSYSNNSYQSTIRSIKLGLQNKQLLNQLTKQKERAEKDNDNKSDFLAGASHDLRQPMHALGLFVESLQNQVTEIKSLDTVKNIKNATNLLADMMTSILDISKLDAGVMQPVFQKFPIQLIIERLSVSLQDEAILKGLHLRICCSKAIVNSDPVMLERMLMNIVKNAIRYTNKGSVIMVCRLRNQQLCIQIKDSGLGIKNAHLKNIYKAFYQVANSNTEKMRGSGLGLAIVDRIAKLLDHKISVDSSLGKGTTFSVYLPLVDKKETSDKNVTKEDVFLDDLIGATILIIDDDKMVRDAMVAVLKKWQCEVVSANNVKSALQQLVGSGIVIDLLVTDYHLANNNTGIEAISELREIFCDTLPAIVITGDIGIEPYQETIPFHVLYKPVAPEKLRSLLSFLLINGSREN